MAARTDLSPVALAENRKRFSANRSGCTPRIKRAVEAFVFGDPSFPVDEPITLKLAAEHVGLKERSFRKAMQKPAVIRFYQEQMQAFRDGQRPSNLRKLVAMRDSALVMDSAAGMRAGIAAIEALEVDPRDRIAGTQVNVGVSVGVESPGYVIDLSASGYHERVASAAEQARDVGHPPLIEGELAKAGVGGKSAATLPVHPPTRGFPMQEVEGPDHFFPDNRIPDNTRPWHPSLNPGGTAASSGREKQRAVGGGPRNNRRGA